MLNLTLTAGLSIAGMLLSAAAIADQKDAGSGLEQLSGQIDYLSVKETKIVIDDRTFLVSPNIPAAAFKKGAKVGFVIMEQPGKRWPVIVQMWPLSANVPGGGR
jgi:hypothetical protein